MTPDRTIHRLLLGAALLSGWLGVLPVAQAQDAASSSPSSVASRPKYVLPPGVTEDMLAPPPMPKFMMEKSNAPLSIEEMTRQAREAEQRVRPVPPAK